MSLIVVAGLLLQALFLILGGVLVATLKEVLDAEKDFVEKTLIPFVTKILSNQTDPADIAEAQEVLDTLKGLVPPSGDTSG